VKTAIIMSMLHRSRRDFLRSAALTVGWIAAHRAFAAPTTATESRYRIAVCDWMILKRQKLGAFQLAQEIGADGIELDMGGLGQRETFDNQLADPAVRERFLAKSRELGVGISSLAMSGFYAQSFPERPGVERMVQDCIDTMVAMGVEVAFLPLGVPGDLRKRPELRPLVVERLREAGRRAERAGVVIAVETMLSAAEENRLLDDIGSAAVQISFNFANALQEGREISMELRTLGRDRVAQIHATDTDGVWLENNPKLNLPKIKGTLDDLDWRGWLIVERSRDVSDVRNVKRNYGANVRHLKAIFQE
jgi:L-ribulose-5-phosphate 3-epimerase